MRKLLTILVLLCPAFAYAGTCGNGYLHGPVQVLLQKAVGADQSNFPYGGIITYLPLRTAANGGQIQNTANNAISVSGPADLVVCDAPSGGNALKYEVAYYSPTTGAIELWVGMSTLHTASNDSIYLFMNNSAVVTSQQDAGLGDCSTNFWVTAGYKFVAHFPDGTTLGAKDSACGLNGTITSATATAGRIDGGANFNGTTSRIVSSSLPTNATTNITMEAWWKWDGVARAGTIIVNGANTNGWGLSLGDTTCVAGSTVSILLQGVTCNAAGFYNLVNNTAWNYYAVTRDTTNFRFYFNGVQTGGTGSSAPLTPTGNLNMGADSAGSNETGGVQDEVRISNTLKSANWIATNYNIQNTPSFELIGQTFATPTVVNVATCSSNAGGGNASCVMPFPVTPGGYLIISASHNGGGICAASVPTDTLGLTWTNQITDNIGPGNAYSCIYSAPITATGADTITIPVGTATWAFVYEVKSITATGVATTSTTSVQPTTLTATAPSNNSFLVCNGIGTNASVYPFAVTPSTYEMRTLLGSDPTFSFRYIGSAVGVVASGAQNCSFNAGTGGAMAIFGAAAPGTKKRQSKVY